MNSLLKKLIFIYISISDSLFIKFGYPKTQFQNLIDKHC